MSKQYITPHARSLHFFPKGSLMITATSGGENVGAYHEEGNGSQISNRKQPYTGAGFSTWNSNPWSYGSDE